MQWLERHIFPAEKAFADRVHADAVAAFFLDELLRHGTTSALVFATVHAGSVDALFEAALNGRLDQAQAEWDRRCALGVVLAAQGYPEEPRKGDRIEGLPRPAADCRVFHAGTRSDGGAVVTSGGRVLCVTALGDNLRAARTRAYDAVGQIRFDGMQYRRDIGHRALREAGGPAAARDAAGPRVPKQ